MASSILAIAAMLFNFESNEGAGRWRIVNDGVMGGLSQSRFVISDDNKAVFEGTLSLDNNGGFASVRGLPEANVTAGTSGIAMRVRGDGREYQLRIRTDNAFDGAAYRWTFKTKPGEWMTIAAPYRDFVPTFRGRILRNVPPIDPDRIRQIGFLIGDKREGRFRLEIDSIAVLP